MKSEALLSCAVLAAFAATPAAAGCADASDAACEIEGGSYHIALPADASGPLPAVLFLHGWGSSGGNAIGNGSISPPILERGYAFIAPDGVPRSNGNGRTWSFHPDWPEARDEVAFLEGVIADAVEKHGVDPEQVILSGFSIGGSMTAYAACVSPEAFDAYAPLGGNFWRPHPETCEGPVRLLHTHGWTDTTVPLEGRYLRDGQIAQGDVFAAFEIWRDTNGCDAMRADSFEISAEYWRRVWERCSDGAALELALFPGGHIVPAGWSDLVLDWYEGL
ncbi:MAG: alpha/beta fold hydrolase [Pseudomonadota bacterium]